VEQIKGYAGMPRLVVAVDGPAGSGKSTAARRVAVTLGLRYLDTGAMYRALTWWLQERQVELTDTAAVVARIAEPRIDVGTDPERPRISVDGRDVAGPIPQVRALLIGRQRAIIAAADSGIVAEGRDIGTVVAPDAAVKVYLTASEEVRARRRTADLADEDPAATVAAVQHEQARRDQHDAGQMAVAADAVQIDTSGFTLDEVVDRVVDLVRSRLAVPHG
jgi:cytidylate kinase